MTSEKQMDDTQPGYAVGHVMAQTAAACMFQNLAVVGALAQAGSINPMDVATWAELFINEKGLDDLAKDQLRKFASLVRSLAMVPADAGRG